MAFTIGTCCIYNGASKASKNGLVKWFSFFYPKFYFEIRIAKLKNILCICMIQKYRINMFANVFRSFYTVNISKIQKHLLSEGPVHDGNWNESLVNRTTEKLGNIMESSLVFLTKFKREHLGMQWFKQQFSLGRKNILLRNDRQTTL